MLRMLAKGRKWSAPLALGLTAVLAGCESEPPLEQPDLPFDPAVTHVPVPIQPGENVIFLAPGDDIEFRAQEAIINAVPGTTLVFPAGTHKFTDEFIVNTSHITIAGMGMDNTILDFAEQQSGAQGILAYGDHFTAQDLSIVDPAGDGIRAENIDGPIFRRVKVEWTCGPCAENGAYGLYPVMSDNVLIEDSVVIGSSDAGIYVGQSNNIIVRRSIVEDNVAGIEIENSTFADVYDNYATKNTAGILVFDIPNLVRYGGQNTRVFDNVVYENNVPNFAPTGNILQVVPSGTGILVMANDQVEVFNNQVRNHGTASITAVSYLITGLPLEDDNYDPVPEAINIHDNLLERPKGLYTDGSDMNTLVNFLSFPGDPAEIIYDGIGETYFGGTSLPEGRELCIRNNVTHRDEPAAFGNLNMQNEGLAFLGIPGGPITNDLTPHDCSHEPLEPIVLPPKPPVPQPTDQYTPEEVAALCDAEATGVNWNAFVVDCPNLADYNLFPNAADPLSGENAGGIAYDLTTPLFTDYAFKHRQVFVPAGAQIIYGIDELVYPVGTIITKTFYYLDDVLNPTATDVIETRLLIRRDHGWQRLPYIWENGVATLAMGGGSRDVSWVDADGEQRSTTYQVPNANQCSSCHGPQQTDKPLGPVAMRLNSDYDYGNDQIVNQLTQWQNNGIMYGLPADLSEVPYLAVWDDETDGSLEERARAYLDSNCAHCHSSEGRASSTGLLLNVDQPLNINYGICKAPIAAGPATGNFHYDIVPGSAETSILVHRLNSADPEVKMPELGKSIVHDEGVELISAWINTLAGTCPEPAE